MRSIACGLVLAARGEVEVSGKESARRRTGGPTGGEDVVIKQRGRPKVKYG